MWRLHKISLELPHLFPIICAIRIKTLFAPCLGFLVFLSGKTEYLPSSVSIQVFPLEVIQIFQVQFFQVAFGDWTGWSLGFLYYTRGTLPSLQRPPDPWSLSVFLLFSFLYEWHLTGSVWPIVLYWTARLVLGYRNEMLITVWGILW